MGETLLQADHTTLLDGQSGGAELRKLSPELVRSKKQATPARQHRRALASHESDCNSIFDKEGDGNGENADIVAVRVRSGQHYPCCESCGF